MNRTTTLDSNFSEEDKLLLYCIQAFLDEKKSSKLNGLLNDEINWSHLIDAAENQRVVSLIYNFFHNNFPELIPKDMAYYLNDKFKKISLRNLVMIRELIQLLDAFSSIEISSVPFKGPVMAIDLYGDLSMRQFSDLDLLIHLADLDKASEILLENGYEPEYRFNRSQLSAFIKSDHHQRFVNPNLGIMVELHWSIYPPIYKIPRIDMGDIWKRAEKNTVFGREVLGFSQSDLLLYLCVHGAKHGWERLSWICDLAMLIKKNEVDFDGVIRLAEEAGCIRLLFLGLLLAEELQLVKLPPPLIERIRADLEISELAAIAISNMFSDREKLASPYKLFYLRATDRMMDRTTIYINDTIRPHVIDYEFIKLPDSLYPLYFIVRPIRLIYLRCVNLIEQVAQLKQNLVKNKDK